MSRRRVLSTKAPVAMPPASNIALYDKTTGKEIVIRGLSYNATDYPVDRFVPVGVVVIPKEHSLVLYPEGHDCYGKDVIMSLKYMRYDTPDTGGEAQSMHWGDDGTDLTIPNYEGAAVVANSEAEEESTNDGASYYAQPSTKFDYNESKAAPKTYYDYFEDEEGVMIVCCPSPYLWKDDKWGPNPAFYNCPATCAQTDRDGKGNTEVILAQATAQSDWRTSMGTPAAEEVRGTVSTVEGLNIKWEVKSGNWTESEFTDAYDGKKFTSVSPGSSGSTVLRCTVSGKAGKLCISYMSDGEGSYDYLNVGNLDTACTRDSYKFTTSGWPKQLQTAIFDIPDENEHYIEFCYSKDGSGDEGADNAEVYIAMSREVVVTPAHPAYPPIKNDYVRGYYPAACCCWRYHVDGVDNQGDWYLPAFGELCYIMPFFNEHNIAMDRINSVIPSSAVLTASDELWSSSEWRGFSAWLVSTVCGFCRHSNKDYDMVIRAFRPVRG